MEALQRLHNRGSISTGYNIDNSLKFEDDNDERMSKTISSTNQKTHTVSLWLKRTELGYRRTWGTGQSGSNEYFFYFDANDYFNFYSYASGYQLRFISNRVFRDTSAWYHLVFAIDTTQSTEADRVKIYVNGVQETSWSTSTYPSQNTDLQIFDKIYVGTQRNENPDFSGYISEFVYLDGTQAAVTDFGEFDADTGIWKPIDVSSLSFGTNGCYLKFNNSSDLGEDANGGTSFTLSNITSADQATDTPTNNFVTFIGDGSAWNANSLDNAYTKEGATTVYHGATTGWATIPTTQGVYGGKWYAELKWNSSYVNLMWGVLPVSRMGELPLNTYLGVTDTHDGFGFYTDSTRVRYYEGTVVAPPTNTLANGDIIQIAMDKDNGYVYFGINNTWTQDVNSVTGVPTSGSSGTGGWAMNYDDAYCFAASLYNPSAEYPVNFGGFTTMTISSSASDGNGYGNFEYAPPSGYYALCTKNLAEYGG